LSGDILLFAATRSNWDWVEGEATKITEFLCLRVGPKLSKTLRPRLLLASNSLMVERSAVFDHDLAKATW
jgi:hypothetical protein